MLPPTLGAPRDAASLIDAAKRGLADDSRRNMLDPMFSPPPRRPPPENPLSPAGAVRPPGVDVLADGMMVRVTATNGRRYCLQAMPEIVTRDLPHAPTAIPTNCP